ncbi:MAG: type II toxin-antitoxin system YoeB family toxin [Lachnospiraceae bacterium]|nr:type II toxin-antitoxin system YoeB family toxin [Lachnospiraceae bacterium]
MIKSWSDAAWEDFEYWMKQDKKTLRRILQLLKDIDRNGYDGIGKPERLSGDLARKNFAESEIDCMRSRMT